MLTVIISMPAYAVQCQQVEGGLWYDYRDHGRPDWLGRRYSWCCGYGDALDSDNKTITEAADHPANLYLCNTSVANVYKLDEEKAMGNFKMRNKILTMTAATVLTVTICIPSFAGQWNDGKCYYFTPDGYCLINTVTPDGYTVNGDGAWTVNDVIQTQTNETSTSLQTWVCSLDYYDGPDGTDPYFGVQIGNSEDSLPDIYQLYDPTGSIPYTIKNKPEWVAYWDVQIVGEIYDGSNGPAIKVHQLTVIQ